MNRKEELINIVHNSEDVITAMLHEFFKQFTDKEFKVRFNMCRMEKDYSLDMETINDIFNLRFEIDLLEFGADFNIYITDDKIEYNHGNSGHFTLVNNPIYAERVVLLGKVLSNEDGLRQLIDEIKLYAKDRFKAQRELGEINREEDRIKKEKRGEERKAKVEEMYEFMIGNANLLRIKAFRFNLDFYIQKTTDKSFLVRDRWGYNKRISKADMESYWLSDCITEVKR